MKITIITGMSGAGRSQAIKALEDAGYYCIDNMPPALMPKFMELVEYNTEKIEKVAFVADIRGRRFFDASVAYAGEVNASRLLLGVYAQNHAAIGFYQRMGFAQVGTRTFHVGSRYYDDWIMGLSLNS